MRRSHRLMKYSGTVLAATALAISLISAGCSARSQQTTAARWSALGLPNWPMGERSDEEGKASVSANQGDLSLPEQREPDVDPDNAPAEDSADRRSGDLIAGLIGSPDQGLPHDPFLDLESAQVADSSIASVAPASARMSAGMDPASPGSAVVNSQIDRLKSVLSDDTERLEQFDDDADDKAFAQAQVNALLRRASREIESGQFDAARLHAEDARALAETAQIVFAPNETRPIDLLRELGRAQEASARREGRSSPDELTLPAIPASLAEGPAAAETGDAIEDLLLGDGEGVATVGGRQRPIQRIPLEDVLGPDATSESIPGSEGSESTSARANLAVHLTLPDLAGEETAPAPPFETAVSGRDEVAPALHVRDKRFEEWSQSRDDRAPSRPQRVATTFLPESAAPHRKPDHVELVRLPELAPEPPEIDDRADPPATDTETPQISADSDGSRLQFFLLGGSIVAMFFVGIAFRRKG